MNKPTSIKETYFDALFFASAPSNKNNDFYLTPSEFKVLIKLIHYSKTYENITFRNKDIAKHIFLAETTVKDSIESLHSKGFINNTIKRFSEELNFTVKRTIHINWVLIQTIHDKIDSVVEPLIIKIPTPEKIEVKVVEIETPELVNKWDKVDLKCISPAIFNEMTDNKYVDCSYYEELADVRKGRKTIAQILFELDNKLLTAKDVIGIDDDEIIFNTYRQIL